MHPSDSGDGSLAPISRHAPPTVLVVDDAPANLSLFSHLLSGRFRVKLANSGARALELANAAPPDLILLDIMMPEMDGYEVLQRLQANEATHGIPVIFITAISDMEGELKGLELGAVDYITKPINPPIVMARVQTHLALRDAQVILEKQNVALLHEREMVEDIITRMRASKYFDDRYLRYLISSVDRTNGDILLAAFTPDGRQWVLVGDFTGHGLPAAVAAPLISYVFYNQAHVGSSIETALEIINSVLCRQLPVNIFMAACLLEISANRQNIRLWNAGLPPCIHMKQEQVGASLETKNPPLGIVEPIDIQGGYASLEVREGDRFYVFSDGVTEVGNPQGELFGIERLKTFLSGLVAEDNAIKALPACLETYRGNSEFPDDITFLEIRI